MLPINCVRCHRVFEPAAGEKLCPICHEEDENSYRRIREYLYDHPGATAAEVANELDVTMRLIKHYLREGRLEVVGEANAFFTCEKCGVPIKTGHYCDLCEKAIASGRIKGDVPGKQEKYRDNNITDKDKSGSKQEKPGNSGVAFREKK